MLVENPGILDTLSDSFQAVVLMGGMSITKAFLVSLIMMKALDIVFAFRRIDRRLTGDGKRFVAAICGTAIAFFGGVDIISAVTNTPVPWLGVPITGVAIAGGAKWWGELIGDIGKGVKAAG